MLNISFTSWETTIEVKFSASLKRLIKLTITPMLIGSCPVNGSSNMIKSGSSAIARANAARRAIPPESSEGIKSAAPRKPTASNFINTI